MKAVLISIAFILCVNTSFSQDFSSRTWHKGWLVTIDDDTLRGDIKYEMEANSIQIIEGNSKVKTLSSKGIIYIQIYDAIVSNYRHFYSIPYQVTSDFRAPILFEVIYEGPVSLLSREKIVVKTEAYNQSFYYSGPNVSNEMVEYSYYFAFTSGEIKIFTGRKGEIYTLLDKYPDKLKTYIKKNKLDVLKMQDLIQDLRFKVKDYLHDVFNNFSIPLHNN